VVDVIVVDCVERVLWKQGLMTPHCIQDPDRQGGF